MKTNLMFIAAVILSAIQYAAGHGDPHLHVNTKWKECSFQLDPSLTQDEWRQFTKEAGLVLYFRPLVDARPMGRGKFEISLLQWNSAIDESDGAWNNTFVHPNETHWLIGGPVLPFPGLTIRAGVTKKLDVGAYWTMRPGANYGVWGAQAQFSLLNDTAKKWGAATRLTFSSLYGPEDVKFNTTGADFLGSKSFRIAKDWLSVSTYAGLSTYLNHSHEKSDVVSLKDENRIGVQGMAGAVAKISVVTLGVEYNMSKVNTFSYKLGVAFNLGKTKS